MIADMSTTCKTFAILLATLFSAVAVYGQEPQREETPEAADSKEQQIEQMMEQTPSQYEGAHISFMTTSYDFGDVRRDGGDLTAEFEYVNDGSEPLVITRITTSCTCIKFDYMKRPLPPGSTSVIRLTYEPHKMEPGTFHKVVQIYTNSEGGVRLLVLQGNSIE